jgi:hypothetical protein
LLERWELERILNELERFFRETPSGGFPSPGVAHSPYYALILSKAYLRDIPQDAASLKAWLEEKRDMSPPEQEKYVHDQIKQLYHRVNQLLRATSDTRATPGNPAGTA